MRTIDSLGDLAGKKVFVRSDFNVPLDGERITDDGRIRAALPTLKRLVDAGARVVVAAHLGRPKGEVNPKFSLAPVAARLSELLGQDGLPPLDASLSAGFHNLSYFYREFRKKYGVTPGNFRGAGAREK